MGNSSAKQERQRQPKKTVDVKKLATSWYVYMVRCSDDTLYTGITTDVTRRVAEHNGLGKAAGAKYTAARRPVQLVYKAAVADKSTAGKEEYRLRNLSRAEKLRYVV